MPAEPPFAGGPWAWDRRGQRLWGGGYNIGRRRGAPAPGI